MRRLLIIGLIVIAVLGVAMSQSLFLRRYIVALPVGEKAIGYVPPRATYEPAAEPPPPPLSPDEAGIDAAALEAAVAYAEPRNTSALVVAHRGHIVFERYWHGTDLDKPVELSEFTPILVALTLGTQLVERRIASVDEPVSNYLPEWTTDARAGITLRQLLAGESALAAPAGWPRPRSTATQLAMGTDLHATLMTWPIEENAAASSNASVEAEVLALIMARKAGRSFADLVMDHLWKPLGAGKVSFALDREGGVIRASCCVRARIGDWMRIGELLVNDGVYQGTQLLPPGFAQTLLRPSREAVQFASRDVAQLEAGGRQRMWIVPSLRLVILRVGWDPSTDLGWDESMIPNSIIRGTPGWRPAVVSPGSDPSKFAPH